MLVTVEGIVIGKRDIGENNCFLDILTNGYGVIEATAHGVRKINSKNASSVGLFSYSRLCFNKTGLRYTLNSAEPIRSFFGLSSDIKKFSLAIYMADIIKYTSTSEQNGEDMLRFFAITLYELEKENSDCDIIKAVFEFRIASMLGFLPDLRACRCCGQYINGKMFFSADENNLVCYQCSVSDDKNEDLVELMPDMLHTLRFVTYSDVKRVYGFTLKGATKNAFTSFSEEYLLKHLGRGFSTLEYYKNLCVNI